MDKIKDHLHRKLKTINKRVEAVKDHKSTTHIFHGGWTKGYWEGQSESVLDMIDLIAELEEKENEGQ